MGVVGQRETSTRPPRPMKAKFSGDSATPFVPQSVPGSEIGSDSLLVKGALVLSVQMV